MGFVPSLLDEFCSDCAVIKHRRAERSGSGQGDRRATRSRLEVYDLDGALGADGADGHYPLLRTVTLPDSANGAGGPHAPVAITSSLDDSAVFVSGDSELLVVPVN